jgi:hypothetical protein
MLSAMWVTAIATVGLFAGAAVTAVFAFLAFGKQKTQLSDQQKANSNQAKVVTAQLNEMAQRALTFERLQADAIVVAPKWWPGEVLGLRDRSGPNLYMAMVHNVSSRPIRNVACRLQVAATGNTLHAACVSGPSTLAGFAVGKQSEDPSVRLIRVKARAGFIFPYDVDRNPDAEITARFTDDAGLHWQIDPDLHLVKLGSRDW